MSKEAVKKRIYRTNRTIQDVCKELGIEFDESLDPSPELDTCSHCSIWYKPKELKPDYDGFPTCEFCIATYGY